MPLVFRMRTESRLTPHNRLTTGSFFSFSARLQDYHGGEAPILIQIQTKAVYSFGKPTIIQIEELTDIYAFLVKELEM